MTKTNNLILVILALMFIAPGISALVFYYNPDWLPATSTNKGKLINPPMLMTEKNQVKGSGSPKWKIELWSPNTCNNTCLRTLDKLARVRLALGRRLYEVEVQLLLGNAASPLDQSKVKLLSAQDIQVVRLLDNQHSARRLLPDYEQIYLVNPDNYAVLVYHHNWEPKAIYQDIKQLLKVGEH